jgi:NAD(P)H-quinone oxidoreductase subunit I
MQPHGVPADAPRASSRPEELLEETEKTSS